MLITKAKSTTFMAWEAMTALLPLVGLAQQTTNTGAPGATTTIDGRYLPTSLPKLEGEITRRPEYGQSRPRVRWQLWRRQTDKRARRSSTIRTPLPEPGVCRQVPNPTDMPCS
jgi:hypothetical protein